MLYKIEKSRFFVAFVLMAILYSVLSGITYGYKPMYGETEVRGLINQEPNVIHPEIYKEIKANIPHTRLIDVYACQDCFLPFSAKAQNTNLKNGLYRSHFQPKLFLQYNEKKYPILFAERIGGLTYAFVKTLKESLSLYSALLFYHILVGILIIYFFGKYVANAYSVRTAQIAMLFLTLSPLHILNNGNFISKKMEALVFWTVACAFYFNRKKTAIFLAIFSGLSVIVIKSTTLINIFSSFLLFNLKQLLKKWKIIFITLFVVFVSGLLLILRDSSGVINEYYQTAEYLKEWKYFQAALLDSILMIAAPLKYMEYFLGLETWHFPFTTYTPSVEDYSNFHPWNRMESWSWFYCVPLVFFFIPVIFSKFFNFYERYFRIYLTWIFFTVSIFFVAHRYFTYSMYAIGSIGFIAIIFAFIYEDLQKIKNKIITRIIISIFCVFYIAQLIQFVDTYRKNGPILTFSFNAYQEIAHDLESRNINAPLMFFVSEMGNLENFSEQIKPIYVPDKMLEKLGDIFNFSQKSYILLQMKPDWYESKWPKSISKQNIIQAADEQNIKLQPIKEYTYRGDLVYWLILAEHLDHDKFSKGDYKIPTEVKNKIYESIPLWR